jgi:proteasome lid subunit RPN8/RPN11
MVMPDSRVALHAASFMPTIDARLRHCVVDGGIGLNVLDLLGTPAGWHWVQVPPFVTLRTTGEGLPEDVWTVRMHPDAFATVKSAATANAPVECGGYLFGRYDLELLTISIAEAVQVTPIETAPSHILLPAAVESSAERDLLTACAGTLMIMGTWHSHPKGSATMSETDRTQCLKVARDNGLTPRPAVMLIISPEGQRAYVVYPDSWR